MSTSVRGSTKFFDLRSALTPTERLRWSARSSPSARVPLPRIAHRPISGLDRLAVYCVAVKAARMSGSALQRIASLSFLPACRSTLDGGGDRGLPPGAQRVLRDPSAREKLVGTDARRLHEMAGISCAQARLGWHPGLRAACRRPDARDLAVAGNTTPADV
jgi:hypothetical protein